MIALFAGAACSGSGDEPRATPTTREQVSTKAADALYVSSRNGSDQWPGSERKPWGTLAHALPLLLPGQTLYVRDGVYREQLVKLGLHDGSPSQRIVVRAYPGEDPLVRGVVWLRHPDFWTLNDIDVTWQQVPRPVQHMVKVTGGEGWVWRNSEIWGARAAANVLIVGNRVGQPSDWTFTGNCVHDVLPPDDVQQGSNLAVGEMRGSGPGEISRNLLFQQSGAVRNIRLGVRRRNSTLGPSDVSLRYNTVYGGGVSVTLAGGVSGVLIERNLFGAPATGTLVRANWLQGDDNIVQGNLGVVAERFFRPGSVAPRAGALDAGPGNLITTEDGVQDASGCSGFAPTTAASAYGRDGLG